jgi:hypothetical protein
MFGDMGRRKAPHGEMGSPNHTPKVPRGFCSSQVDNFYGFWEPLVAGDSVVDCGVSEVTFLPLTPIRTSRTVKVAARKAEYQNRPSATLRTFVHVSHRSVSHGKFSNFLLSELPTWAEKP